MKPVEILESKIEQDSKSEVSGTKAALIRRHKEQKSGRFGREGSFFCVCVCLYMEVEGRGRGRQVWSVCLGELPTHLLRATPLQHTHIHRNICVCVCAGV